MLLSRCRGRCFGQPLSSGSSPQDNLHAFRLGSAHASFSKRALYDGAGDKHDKLLKETAVNIVVLIEVRNGVEEVVGYVERLLVIDDGVFVNSWLSELLPQMSSPCSDTIGARDFGGVIGKLDKDVGLVVYVSADFSVCQIGLRLSQDSDEVWVDDIVAVVIVVNCAMEARGEDVRCETCHSMMVEICYAPYRSLR